MLTDYQMMCIKEIEDEINNLRNFNKLLIEEKTNLYKDIKALRRENSKLKKELEKYTK